EQRPRQARDLLHVDDVGARLVEHAAEEALDARLGELELGLAAVVVKRRVDDLEHGDVAAPAAAQARAQAPGVVAPAVEVADLVAAADLRAHQILDVGDEPAPAQLAHARADVQHPHRTAGAAAGSG